jgi:alanyl-tRNA synthetase
LLEFDATIISSVEQDGCFVTILDRSAFYPTSGGQQFDTGLLNGVAILDVIEADNEVLHISLTPVGKVGESVHGAVDPNRRRTHRQQHTAQHILSQSFIKLYGFETVSVHLGDEYGAIELDRVSIDPSQLDQVERYVNDIVSIAWLVEILFVSGPELDRIPLRKVPSREGEIRVIKIGEFDYSACGGTHCNKTSEVGLIKIIGWEKLRAHALVKFLAGTQALEDYRLRFDVTDTLTRAYTCGISDLAGKIDKLANENKALRKEVGILQKELLPVRAQELSASAEDVSGVKLACRVIDTMDAATACQLGMAVADRIGGIALLVAEGKLLLTVAANGGQHAGEIAGKLSALLGLKGGGSSRAAQLGGADPTKLQEYRAALLSLIGHE